MAILEAIAVVAILITLILVAERRCRIKGIPGPPQSFILGNTLQFGGNFCKTWLDWKKIYGPVFQLRVFNKPILILNDKQSVVECFGKAEAAGRLAFPAINVVNDRFGMGFGGATGRHLEENRQFFMKAFKEFGMTKQLLEDRLWVDIEALFKVWTAKKGNFFDLRGSFDSFVVNSVWNLMSSNRFSAEEGSALMHTYLKVGDSDSWGRKFFIVFPRIFEFLLKDSMLTAIRKLTKCEMKFLEEHRRERVPGEPRDVLDMFLDKVDATTDSSSSFFKPDDKAITALIRDVQLGATTTTSHSLEWTVIYGCNFPETIRRLQAEIDSVIGPSGTPSLSHKDQMPYAEAFILETTRLASVLPISVPHGALVDFELRGNVIPKGTLIFSNIWGMSYDPEVWADAEEFRPERFLNEEGRIDSTVKNQMITFGTGKRSCIGRVFAEDQMFLVVVSMYHKFTFETEKPLDSLDGIFGITNAPPNGVRIRAVPRQ